MRLLLSPFGLVFLVGNHVAAFQPVVTSRPSPSTFHSSNTALIKPKHNAIQKHDAALDLFKLKEPETAVEESTSVVIDDDVPSFALNPLFATFWVGFLSYAAFLAPGEFGSATDTAMLQNYIDNPTAPMGFNPLFLAIFNLLGLAPLLVATLAVPQGRPAKGLPAGPFMAAGAGAGFAAIGIYLALRAPPRESIDRAQVSWFTRNVLENKLLAVGLSAALVSLPVVAGVFSAPEGLSGVWQGYVELCSTSKFASVSTLDMIILYASMVALTPRDYQLRTGADAAEANKVAALTAVLPYLGTALYLLWRPSLPDSQE